MESDCRHTRSQKHRLVLFIIFSRKFLSKYTVKKQKKRARITLKTSKQIIASEHIQGFKFRMREKGKLYRKQHSHSELMYHRNLLGNVAYWTVFELSTAINVTLNLDNGGNQESQRM